MNNNEKKKTISEIRKEYKQRLANGEVVFHNDEDTAKNSSDAPVEEPSVAPVEKPVEESSVAPVAEPVEETPVAPVEEPVEEPSVEPVAEPVEEPSVAPVAESVEEPSVEPVAEPVEETPVAPTEEPVEEPSVAPVAEPVEEPSVAPTAEPVEETPVAPVEEAVEETPVVNASEVVAPVEASSSKAPKKKKSEVKKTKKQLKPKRQVEPLSEEELEVLDSSFSKLRDQIAQLKKEEKETKKKDVPLFQNATPLESEVAPVEATPVIDNLFSEDLYSQRISELEEQINDLKIDNDELQSKLDEYSLKCREQEQTIEVLEAKPTTTVVQESVFGLDKFDELESQISELKAKVDQLEDEKQALQAELTTSNFEINDLTSQLTDADIDYQNLKEDYDTLHKEFTSYKSIKFSELDDGSLKQENLLLKEALQTEKINNEKLTNVLEQEKQKNFLLNNELNTTVLDKNQTISDLENTLKGCQMTLENRAYELKNADQELNAVQQDLKNSNLELLNTKESLYRVKEELAQANIQISSLKAASSQDYNHHLESQIAALASAVEKLSTQPAPAPTPAPVQAPAPNPYYMYEQEKQVRQLREEMNSKFEEQERQKYNAELEKLKAEVSSLNLKIVQNNTERLIKADQELNMLQSEIDKQNDYLKEVKSEDGIHYTKNDITDPNFKREYNKLEQQIKALLYDISEDTKRYNLALSRNSVDLSKREMMIEQINKELENLVNQYHQNPTNSMDYKEIYERERIKATEKIRFHNERIREILSSNEMAAKKHQAYMMEKNHQVEVLRNRQDQLVEHYINQMLEKDSDGEQKPNEDRNLALQEELNRLRFEHEEKSRQLAELTSEVKKSQVVENEVVVPAPVHEVQVVTPVEPVVVAPIVDPAEEKRILEIKKAIDEYKDALSKLRAEQEKRVALEKEMRVGDEMVAEYYTFYTSLSGLKEDQLEIANEKKLLNGNISDNLGDPNKRQEVLAARARLEDLAVREQDTLSKISYTNNRLRELIRDPEVIKYQSLVANMSEIQKRIDSLKTKIVAKNNELRSLSDAS